MLNDSRINPRVKANFAADILLAEQQPIEVPVANISLTGIMLDATQVEFRALLGERHTIFSPHQTEPREMDLKFCLPGGPGLGRMAMIDVRCRAVYVRRISQNCFHIGLKFIQLDAGAEAKIAKFVSVSLLAKSRPAMSA